MQWYYAVDNKQNGPVTQEEFDALVREGVIVAETKVWKQGMANWQAYSEIAPAAPMPSPGAPEFTSRVSPVPSTTVVAVPSGDLDTEVCIVSGKRYPKREMIQYEGRWISAEHRDTYFQRLREGVVAPGAFRYANFGARFVAWLIDALIIFAGNTLLGAMLGYGIFGPRVGRGGADLMQIFASQGRWTLFSIAWPLLYDWFFISRSSATPGKMAMGIKLIRSDGSRLSNGRIVGRYFARLLSGLILYIGYIMAAFDDEKRALHDRICDTRVVKAK